MSRDQQSIKDILDAAKEILSFLSGMDYEALDADSRTQAAIMYEIIVIGEAANRLSKEFRLQHSSIPWKDIVGMRNILAHQYDRVDSEVVWDAATQDIPELISLLEPLLADF